MTRIEELAAEARRLGIAPWLAIKQRLARCAIGVLAESAGTVVLQGGAALHFAYGSPRLSADVDVVGVAAADVLARRGPDIARAAGALLECPAEWSLRQVERLTRGKVTLALDPVRRLVLPIEAYPVPAYTARPAGDLGLVEEPAEIVADKLVASADRLARRGTLKTTDLFDLWFARRRLGAPLPALEMVAAKAADYGQPRRGADLAAAVGAVPAEELRAVLEGVLPAADLAAADPAAIIRAAAEVAGEYRDVL